MGLKIKRNALYGPTTRHAIAQLFGVGICTAVLLLFVALTYSQITLPHYTAKYNQKDTQQVVSLLITVAATLIGILLNHCRRCVVSYLYLRMYKLTMSNSESQTRRKRRKSCTMKSLQSLDFTSTLKLVAQS